MLERIKAEPAILLGLLATLVTAAVEFANTGLNWSAFVPLALGIVTRFFVTPAGGTEPAPEPEEPPL